MAPKHGRNRLLQPRSRPETRNRHFPGALLVSCALAVCFAPTLATGQNGSATDATIAEAIRRTTLEKTAKRHYKAKRYRAAATAYRELTSAEPSNGKAWHRLAYCELKNAKFKNAARACRRQLEAGYEPHIALYNSACAAACSGDDDAAFLLLERAIRRGFASTSAMRRHKELRRIAAKPRFAELVQLAKDIARKRKVAQKAYCDDDWQTAIPALRAVIQEMPDVGRARYRLGCALLESGRADASKREFAKQIDLGYCKSSGYFELARAAAIAGARREAMEHLEECVDAGFRDHKQLQRDPILKRLRTEPRFETLRKRVLERAKRPKMAALALEVGDWEMARRLYAELVASDPNDGSACAKLAEAHYELGNYRQSIEARREQIRHRTCIANGLFDMACAHAKLGEKAAAFAHLEQAVAAGFDSECRLRTHAALAPLRHDRRLRDLRRRITDACVLDKFGAHDWKDLQKRAEAKIVRKPKRGDGYLQLGWAMLRQGQPERAIRAFTKQFDLGHRRSVALLNLACVSATNGDKSGAFRYLEKLLETNCGSADCIAHDVDLESLHGDPRFADYLNRLRAARLNK